MYRFLLRPKWLVLHVVVLALVVTMINLGLWQLRRLHERQSFNSEVRAQLAQAPQPLDALLVADSDPTGLEWRQVSATGTYEPSAQILIRDRSLNSIPGFNVVTPLRLADGTFLIVVRGWVPGDVTTAPAAPSGTISLTGRLRVSQVRRHSWEKADPDNGVLDTMNRVDIARIDQQVAGTAQTMYVEAATSDPADESVTAIPTPELSDGPHLSYTVQWFLFTLAALAGWVIAVRRHIAGERKAALREQRAAEKASAAATAPEQPSA